MTETPARIVSSQCRASSEIKCGNFGCSGSRFSEKPKLFGKSVETNPAGRFRPGNIIIFYQIPDTLPRIAGEIGLEHNKRRRGQSRRVLLCLSIDTGAR
mgnify:CR=1 FL=1